MLGPSPRQDLLPGPARALRMVLRLWNSGAEAAGRVVVLDGAPGAGKTSVIHALETEVGESCEVLAGTEWAREVPLSLLRQLRTEVPLPAPGEARSQPGERLRLAEALLAELQAADAEPRLIVLDDVHLADPQSLQVLSLLGRRLRGTRVLLLVASDPTLVEHTDPDFLRMTTAVSPVHVGIEEFGREDALALARAHGLSDIGEHGAAALVTHSGGRLLTAREILSLLPEGRWPVDPADLPVPPSAVRAVLDALAEAGSSDVEDIAYALAILRDPVDLDRVMKVAGVADLDSALDLGIAHAVFREHDAAGRLSLRLCHPDAARVLLSTMTPSTRRFLHERAAQTATLDEDRLVHLAAAARGTDDELAERLSEAAAQAERFGRWEDAAGLHFGAARVLTTSPRRDGQLLAGIDALASAGRVTEVLRWIEIGRNLAPSALRDTVLANVAIHRGHAAQADALLTRAVAAPAEDDDLRAQIAVRRTLDSLVRWDGPQICAWTDQAMALSSPEDPAHVESLVIRGLGFAAQGRIAEARRELTALAGRRLGGAQDQRLRLCAGWVALLAGDHRTAVSELEAAAPTQHERGSLRISLWARGWLARAQYLLGEWDEALRTAEQGLRECDEANITLLAPLLAWTAAEIRLWRGHPVDETMRRAQSGAILSDYRAMQVPARLVRAVAADVRGDHDGRAGALRPLPDVDPWTTQRISFWPWSGDYVDALLALDRREDAEAVAAGYAEATTEASPLVRADAEVARARIAQDAGRTAEAEERLDRALELLMDGQNDTAVARVLFCRGQMLRRANRRRAAVDNLVRAREFYEGVGATVHVTRCDQELRATGMSWRGMPDGEAEASGAAGRAQVPLTPQEVSVADLVVRGMTNAEVSRKLFIAEKTVQYHLTNIYGKFGIRSRTELAAVHLSDAPPG